MNQQLTVAENQVARVEESKKVIDELVEDIRIISQSTTSVEQLTSSASEKTSIGSEEIKLALGQLNLISDSVKQLSSTMLKLGDHSKQIGNIIGVIRGISEQTNLLALNAAIEAARAGEHGKGFSVVASEVRKLAEESSDSSQKITELIQAMQAETTQVLKTMDTSTNDVTSGIQKVSTLNKTFSDIREAIEKLRHEIGTVSAKTYEIENNTGKVTESVDAVRSVMLSSLHSMETVTSATDEQLASTEEVSTSAVSLSYLADDLNKLIQRFKV
ncbi:methyl-accepting chemotaxis protein [Bacillus sp. SG-1]|uniref:methyl-accepting chemotaxis protein n=1 Tax=Bacillus sp. SG-1 TaxID=161544 RepID=UPI003FA4376E